MNPVSYTMEADQDPIAGRADAAPPHDPLLERAAEVAALDAMLDAVERGEGGCALIEGPAGIGKTRLVRELVARAQTRGVKVALARGTELERDFAFGGVRQLFEPLVASTGPQQRDELFSGAAALAAPLLTRTAVEQPPSADEEATFAVLHGLYWLTANYASQRPLVVVVDDAHWADAPTLRFLAYLVNRIGDLAVLAVVVRRSFEPGTDTQPLDEIAETPGTRRLRPVPLGADGVKRLVAAFFDAEPAPAFVSACVHVTGGNPLLLRELLFALQAQKVAPVESCVDTVLEAAPDTLATSLLRRLQRLGPDASALARAVALLGERADLPVAAQLAGLAWVQALEATDALTRAGIFSGEQLGFAHPIVGRAIYGEIPALERTDAHASVARLLAARGADDDEVAVHLLATSPQGDAWPVEVLVRAADWAQSRGAPDVAATYLRRALMEPPDARMRTQILFRLGLAKTAASDASGFADLRLALRATESAEARARLAVEVARAHFGWGNFSAAAEVAREALGGLPAGGGATATRLEALMLGCAFLDEALLPGVEDRLLELSRDPRRITDPVLLATTAVFATARFEEHAEAPLADRALRSESGTVLENILTFGYAANALMTAGRLGDARRVWDRLVSDARLAGSQSALRFVSSLRAYLLLRLGDVNGAEADARFSLDHLPERVGAQLPFLLAPLVDVHVERGDLAEAAQAIELEPAANSTSMFQSNYLLDSVARLRLAEGRGREAIDHLRECGRSVESWGIRNPGVLPWRTSLALALVAEGEHEEASALAGEDVVLARAFAVTRELGMALRAAALASPEPVESLRLLRESVQALERSEASLELARSLADLGRRLRERGDRSDSRDPLRRSLDLAIRCGADALAARAHEELLASGGRPRRLVTRGADALTASERRVAAMAADGLTNKEIAQALFLSEKTVEGHLGQAYRKLEIKARSQLRQALADLS
ncbi:MAG TPA: AAA family ATPase [Solirubrobacteraceae bacterium]